MATRLGKCTEVPVGSAEGSRATLTVTLVLARCGLTSPWQSRVDPVLAAKTRVTGVLCKTGVKLPGVVPWTSVLSVLATL